MELYKRALKQKFISLDDARRFNDVELSNLIVSDSINGAIPKSLFNVNESISERVRLSGDVISQSDFNQITTEQKQEFISKGVYPVADAPTILTNLPYITRGQFEAMSPSDRQIVISDKIQVKEPSADVELDTYQLLRILKEAEDDKDSPED